MSKTRWLQGIMLAALAPLSVTCGDSPGCPSQFVLQLGDPNPFVREDQCLTEFDQCSDGSVYTVTCTQQPDTETLNCECDVDGQLDSTFQSDACPVKVDKVNGRCGWDITHAPIGC